MSDPLFLFRLSGALGIAVMITSVVVAWREAFRVNGLLKSALRKVAAEEAIIESRTSQIGEWETKAANAEALNVELRADAEFWLSECNRMYDVNNAFYRSVHLTPEQSRRIFRRLFPNKTPSAHSFATIEELTR